MGVHIFNSGGHAATRYPCGGGASERRIEAQDLHIDFAKVSAMGLMGLVCFPATYPLLALA